MPTRRWSPSCGLRPMPASCEAAGVLPDSSHGVHLKDCPSVDNKHVSSLRVRYRPRRAGCPAGWTCSRSGLRLLDHRGFVASLRPQNANPGTRSALVVSHDFGGLLLTRSAGLLHPAADHRVRLVAGNVSILDPHHPLGARTPCGEHVRAGQRPTLFTAGPKTLVRRPLCVVSASLHAAYRSTPRDGWGTGLPSIAGVTGVRDHGRHRPGLELFTRRWTEVRWLVGRLLTGGARCRPGCPGGPLPPPASTFERAVPRPCYSKSVRSAAPLVLPRPSLRRGHPSKPSPRS
jgi:hypothetical protein